MARTSTGKLTGQAAAIARRDLLDEWEVSRQKLIAANKKRMGELIGDLKELDHYWEAWYDNNVPEFEWDKQSAYDALKIVSARVRQLVNARLRPVYRTGDSPQPF